MRQGAVPGCAARFRPAKGDALHNQGSSISLMGACSPAQRAAPCSCVTSQEPRAAKTRSAKLAADDCRTPHHPSSGAFAHAACTNCAIAAQVPPPCGGPDKHGRSKRWAGRQVSTAKQLLGTLPPPHALPPTKCASILVTEWWEHDSSDRLPDHCPILPPAHPSLHRVSVGALTTTRATVVSQAKRSLAYESRARVSRVLSGWRHGRRYQRSVGYAQHRTRMMEALATL
jgi:hypothetical protein